jgi:hypothetical protein
MSRPAGIKQYRSPFVKPAKKWPEGKKVGLSEKVLEEEPGTYRNLQLEIRTASSEYIQLMVELREAQRRGKRSKVQKLKRLMNQHIDLELYLQNLAWCSSCRSSSGNCHCDDPDWVPPVREEIVIPKQEVKEDRIRIRVFDDRGIEAF